MLKLLCLFPLVLLVVACTPDDPCPCVRAQTDRIVLESESGPALTYWLTPQLPENTEEHYRRSGFIHPVLTPAGDTLTDGFPVGHVHQHGIFTAWTNTTFRGDRTDFWNQHKETGTVRHDSLLEVIEADGVAGFRARLVHESLKHGDVLEDIWHVRLLDSSEAHVFELRSEQTNITEDTLFLNRHLYGGLGVRGAARWNEEDSLRYTQGPTFSTSEGKPREEANHTRPAWTQIAGDEGALRVIPDPRNFGAPEFVRIHPTMPYLSITPTVEDTMFLAPGQTIVNRYRFEAGD